MVETVVGGLMFVSREATWEVEDDEVDGRGSVRTGADGIEADTTG